MNGTQGFGFNYYYE